MEKYYIGAIITAKQGYADQLKEAILNNIPKVREEKGCILYDFHQNMEDENLFFFYEIWEDKAAFDAHGVAPHMLEYRANTKEWCACPTQIWLWNGIDVTR